MTSISTKKARIEAICNELTFVVPPECRGQIIELAYSVDAEREEIVCRSIDASEDTVSFAVTSLDNLVGDWEPWNHRPKFADDGLWTTVIVA